MGECKRKSQNPKLEWVTGENTKSD